MFISSTERQLVIDATEAESRSLDAIFLQTIAGEQMHYIDLRLSTFISIVQFSRRTPPRVAPGVVRLFKRYKFN